MPLQGPILVVAERPAADLVEALSAAGAFPIVEAAWADAPAAFTALKPVGVVIAEPGQPVSESSARMLCLQVATATGAMVPAIAGVRGDEETAIPVALPIDAALPVERLIARLDAALRVRGLHAAVLRRIETFAAQGGRLPLLPVGDALEDATVLAAGRGPLYPSLAVTIGERVKMVGALSVETAARHLTIRDIDGIVIGDGFSPRMVEAFLTVIAQEPELREIPVAVIGETPDGLTGSLPNVDYVEGDPARLITRMLPRVRLRAMEMRLKRMLRSLDADGMFDPDTGLFTREAFWREMNRAIAQAAERSQPFSLARFSFDGPIDARSSRDGARLLTRLIRNFDFGVREEDGSLLVAFGQTNLRSAHVVARRIAGALKNTMLVSSHPQDKIAANVTLATMKAGDTIDSLLARVMGSRVVAAE
jgi:hypothetical protein